MKNDPGSSEAVDDFSGRGVEAEVEAVVELRGFEPLTF